MNSPRFIRLLWLVIPILLLSACAPQAKPVTYKTVSTGTLKAGNTIPAPTSDVVLTIDGKISQKNAGDVLKLDMATLESMGLVEYAVNDPFAKKKVLYTGVLFSDLLKLVGVDKDATKMTLLALDDYSTDMKIDDVNKWPIMIAIKADGAYMPLGEKGPLFSVLPFDDYPDIDHLTYDSQSVWALTKITVK